MASKKDENPVIISQVHMTEMRFNIVGTSPLVPHSVSAKAKGALLFPSPRKNAAERASTMKHEPFEEFVEAAYRFTDDEAAEKGVRLYMPASCIHSTMAMVAIDMIGAAKAQVGRLTSVPGLRLPLFGVPDIWTTLVRSSDMKKTPDIRSLPILKQWALPGVIVNFVGSLIKDQSIANLLANAGVITGIGDGRPEKGKLTMGCFRLVGDDDPELKHIMKVGTLKAQDAALADPKYYDIETQQLLEWFLDEKKKRSAQPAQGPKRRATVTTPHVAPAAIARKRSGNGRRRATD
jgi:hypothetical protein